MAEEKKYNGKYVEIRLMLFIGVSLLHRIYLRHLPERQKNIALLYVKLCKP